MMPPWTRVQSSFVAQPRPASGSWEHSTRSVWSCTKHSIGAIAPSSACTTSSIAISSAGRESQYPPCAPRALITRPALRSRATTCSRYASGRPSASAIAFRLVGCSGDWRPSSTISRTPYSAFEEKIMDKSYHGGRLSSPDRVSAMDVRGLATPDEVPLVAAAAREHGRLGIDTEFMSEGRYRALLCLVQVVVDAPDEPEGIRIILIDA